MKLRTYQAYTMAEALAAVKHELGAEAVILNTRTFTRGGLLGIGRRTIVEVTATLGQKAAALRAAPARVSQPKCDPLRAAARKAYAPPVMETVTDEDRERTRRLALAMVEKFERERGHVDAAVKPDQCAKPQTESDDGARIPRPSVGGPPAAADLRQAADREPQRFILMPPEKSPSSVAAPPPAMQQELAAIRDMVGQVLQRQTRSNVAAGAPAAPMMPAKLFDFYLRLISQDISEELADRIVNEVRDELSTAELDDEAAVKDTVLRRLSTHIPVADQPVALHSSDGRPLTIALIGPTGVGKTTTLAKLAATFKLRHHRRVGLVTSDTYRIAAVDQLRTYANIIGLPLQVVLTPGEMRQAVHVLSDCDVILIDTAGRGQNDASRLAELREFLAAASPHEVHLVLSSTASEKVLLREAEAFGEIGIDKIVLTKLDEAVSFGMVVNVVRQVGKQLSFITTGQEVPHHIERGRPERLAELILGGAVHAESRGESEVPV